MNILLAQLSDIHLNSKQNCILNRVSAIKSAIQGADATFLNCFIVVTGDIAFAGTDDEYIIAEKFFRELRSELLEIRPNMRVEEIFIPGNHDCKVKSDLPVRDLVIRDIVNSNSDDLPQGELLDVCLSVQNNFFNFLCKIKGKSLPLSTNEKIFYFEDYYVGEKLLRFECYNTAWLTKLHETPGELLAPIGVAFEHTQPADFVISVFHHPYNWLNPINGKAFRKEVERRSDAIMTGHEHVAEQFSKRTIAGISNDYFEGAVLQESSNKDDSGFNILLLDIEHSTRKALCYFWDTDHYRPKANTEWESFSRAEHLKVNRLENTPDFGHSLSDIGAPFTHPAKSDLNLRDIFVYPDFEARAQARIGGESIIVSSIDGDKTVKHILDNEKVIFIGSERSGKSSLAKVLYTDLQDHGLTPLLLDGSAIRHTEAVPLQRAIDNAVVLQYGVGSVERFKQCNYKDKVLIVDNFHLSKMNESGRNVVLSHFEGLFKYIVLMASEGLQFRELTNETDETKKLLSYQHCQLRDFGLRLRGRLIEKWFSLGNELVSDEREIVHKVKCAETLIGTLLGKNLLPSQPFFVLTMLQQFEAMSNLDAASGAYGHYYEFLIKSVLQNRSNRIPLDMIVAFTSNLAYKMFELRQRKMQRDGFDAVVREYQTQFKVSFNSNEMFDVLINSQTLYCDLEGNFDFKYKGIGPFFVAKFIASNLYSAARESEMREQIHALTEKLHVEYHANIVIFLVYLTKDEKTIMSIVEKAKTLFADYAPCDLSSDIKFVDSMKSEILPLQLENGSTESHRDDHRRHIDENNKHHDGDDEEDWQDDADIEKQENDLIQHNAAFKTLQIMGQILRNFPGTLPGEIKLVVAKESYLLGLRALNSLFKVFESNIDFFKIWTYEFLLERVKLSSTTKDVHKDLSEKADEFLYAILLTAAYSIVKRISYAVGSEYLKETYEDIVDERIPISIQLINSSVKLDHFKQFPEDEISNLHRDLNKNLFTTTLLRRMVRDYFYLYPADYKLRQRVCAKLGIAHNAPKALSSGHKKTS